MSGVNLHLHPSGFKYETRICKETKTLADSGLFDNIIIAAVRKDDLGEYERLDDRRMVWRVRLRTGGLWRRNILGKIVRHIEWSFRVLFRFRRSELACVNCHTLSCLPVGVLLRVFSGAKLVYDTHELETERNGWSRPRKAIARLLERSLIHKADLVFAVSDSIAGWYKRRYNLPDVYVVRNTPDRRDAPDKRDDVLRRKFGVGREQLLFIHQGLLGPARGIELLLEVFSQLDDGRHIVFMGRGPLEGSIRAYESRFSNIHFQPAVPQEQILRYTGSCDIGVHLPANTCLSYYYSLPNKFFEYLAGGLPVIVSDFPEMGGIVDRDDCGWKVRPDTAAVMGLIEGISRGDIEEKRKNVLAGRGDYFWDSGQERMLDAYYDKLGAEKAVCCGEVV